MSPGSTIRAAPARREWRTGEEPEAGHDVSAPQLAPAERLAVRLQSRAGRPLAGRVAATVVRGDEPVCMWVARPEIDVCIRAAVSTAENADLKQLRQENRELRRANEIPLRAAGPLGRGTTSDSDDRQIR